MIRAVTGERDVSGMLSDGGTSLRNLAPCLTIDGIGV
jgi:hypothetical protein